MTIFTKTYPCPVKQVRVPAFTQLLKKVIKKSSCPKQLLLFIITVLCTSNATFSQNILDNTGLSSSSLSEAAFSLRKLSSTYAGFAITVRRSSDNTLQNIGFTAGGDLDTTALKIFTGTASGFVATWYDQSGNGRNATQSTTAGQPRIVNGGTVDLQNGRPAITFSGSQNMLTTLTAVQATTGGNTTTANAVFTSSTINSSILSNNSSTASQRYNIHAPWSDGRTYFDIGDNNAGGRINAALTWNSLSVGTFQRNNATGNIWKNGLNIITSASMASTVTSSNAMYIGSFQATSVYMNGAIPELIVFASAISNVERQALECNQFSYYFIADAVAPAVTCPATQSINLISGCTATMPNYLSLATATDNCTASGSIVLTQSPAAGSTLSGLGTQIVTIIATDLAGNTSNCTFNLNKLDITAPVISCPSDINVSSSPAICGASVSFTVSATDDCSGNNSCIPSNISSNYILVGTYGGHTYYRSNFTANWATAKANAIALGGHLLTLSSVAENNLFNGLGSHWAGFTDEAVEGTFVWVTGEPVVFTNWAPAEPNNYNGTEDHMQLNWNASYNWNDYTGTTTYPYVIEFECAPPALNLITGFASGSTFPVGITTVTYNATDAAGNTSSNCSFTVTVNDVTAPTIVCPANINVNAAAGVCDAVVNYNAPVASDNCGSCSSSPAISSYTSLGIYNGSAYYISTAGATGPTAFSAAAALGASLPTIASAAENNFVRNAANAAGFTGPYLIGINDLISEGTFVGFAGETLSYTNWNGGEPNNSGNEDYVQVFTAGVWNDIGASTSNNYVIKLSCITPLRTAGLVSGSTFPVGTSTINYSATDPSGNTSNCSFTVTVSVNPTSLGKTVGASTNPVCINNTTNITVAASDNGISYQLRNNTGNVNIGSAVTGTGGTINLPTGNLTATTTFNVFATGSTCSYQLTNTITITVNPAATVTTGSTLTACQSPTPSAITLTGASVGGSATTGAWSITAGGGSLSSTAQTATPATVTYTPAANYTGTVTLTLTTNNPAGPCGAVSDTRTITVNPLPTNLTPAAAASTVCSGSGTNIQIPTSQIGVNYQLRNNTGNVNIGSAVAGTGGTIDLPTGNLTSATTFNVLATDATTGCSRQLTTTATVSMDNTAPVISCPSAQTVNLDASCAATLPNYTSLAVASDNCTASGSITITQSPVAGTTLSGAGSQIITLTATDESGNSSNCTFNVTKLDITAPVISCPADITTNATSGVCGAVVNFTITATDNCSVLPCAPASISGYTLIGNYAGHTYYRSNFTANWATAKANAIALGGHLLTLSSVAENNLFNGLGTHWAGFTDEAVEGTFVWVTGEPVVFTNWAPAEPNNYNGTEDHMQLNWNASYNWNDYTGTTTYPYVVEFECGSPTLTLITGIASGSVFPVGITTVTYNATDPSGNTSSNCSFTVTVNDVTAPTIVCPANISVNAAAGACDAVVNYNAPVASDNCGSCSASPAISGYTSLGIYSGSAYYISTAGATGPTAFSAAAALGASVPTIASAAENNFVRNAATAANFTGAYLIGINDITTEGTFVGFAGETLSYTNWNAGEPNNSSGFEDYTVVFSSGVWNDVGAGNSYNYIIKISCITPVKTSGFASGSIFPVGTSTINYSATDPSGNTSNCSFTVTVSVNPTSLGKTVGASTNPVCINNTTNITVAASDNGISYQLRNNTGNVNIGSAVTGTGGTINLPTGNLTATTTFNVFATGSTCSYQLTNTITITVNPAATVTTGSTLTACQSPTPSAITLTGASVGGSATTGAWSVTAGGGSLSSTAQTATPATVTYTPAANYTGTVTLTLTTNNPAGPCGAVSDTRTITVNPLPTNLTPAAAASTVCSGSGTNIQIPTSQIGVNYQLRNNSGNVNIGTVVAGTGATINLPTGNLISATIFNVLSTNATTGCNRQLTTTVAVSLSITDKTPTAVLSSVCTGSSTNIQITTSQSGVTYQLRNNTGNINIGSAVAGNNGTINLPTGTLISNTTFNVLATLTSSGCTVQMANTVTVNMTATGQWVGASTGDWNTASNWCGGVPTNSTNAIIPAGTTVNIQSANAVANSVTIASTGSLVMTGVHNLTITSNGSFTNNGTFNATASTGTVAFLGNGTISGTTTFRNIDTYGALNFGTSSTVSGTFSLQTGGSVTGNSPTYTCPTAILAYKPGSTFTRGLEWTNSFSGAGYPANVIVQNNTTINFPSGGDGYVCYDLTIDNGSSLRQDFSGGSAALRVGRNVNITGTLSLGNSTGGDIYIGGNWIRNTGGVFNANNRLVTFDGPSNFSSNGTSMSTITAPASSLKDNEGGFGGEKFAHLWINKTTTADSVVLLSNITVNRELGLTRGTFSLRNSDVTIVSNITRTADIAPIITPANINVRYAGTGKFVIQRFVQNPTGVRSWRLLTAPLQDATAPTINEAWQEGVVNPDRANPNGSGGIYNPWPGYGTHISGPGGTYNLTDGFDHGTNTASILNTNSGITTWTWPSSTKATKITAQQGWMVFIRGDRSFAIGNQYVPSQNSILEPKGRINTGNVTVAVAAGKQIVGNPYPSAISLLDVDIAGTAGKNSSYYMWDPKMFTSYTQPGKWVTFTGVGNSFVQTTSESPYLDNGTVESGQAFVVEAASAGNVTFHESDKQALTSSLVGIANATGARPTANPVFAIFRSDVYAKNDTTYKLTDAVLNIFSTNYNNAADEADAKKFISFNTKESLSILRDSVKMAIEKRSDINETDTIFFSITKFNLLPYQFRFNASNFIDGYEAFLEDRYTGTSTPVSMYGETLIDFTINADSLSKAANRFKVVFQKRTLIVLPVTLTSINANRKGNNVLVSWTTENEINLSGYEIEKSTDGNNFTKIGSRQTNNNTNAAYNFTDENATNGMNFYRVKMTDRNGQFKYSAVVYISMNKKGTITVYPNPVVNNTVQLLLAGQEKGHYKLTIYNSHGQNISSDEFNCSGTDTVKAITLNNVLPKGIYNAEIVLPNGKKTTIQIAVQ